MAQQSKKKDDAEYAQPTSQLDLEARQESGNRSSRILSTADSYEEPEDDEGRSYAVEDNDLDGYIGTNPEYMTYANETEAPIVAEEGAEAKVEEAFLEDTDRQGRSALLTSAGGSGSDDDEDGGGEDDSATAPQADDSSSSSSQSSSSTTTS